jgi:hypothetical protein
MTPLEPNRRHLEAFIDAVFRRATRGFVSIRSFRESDTSEKFRFSSSPVDKREHLLDVVEDDARRAAQAPSPVVFCPPLCTFNSEHSAKEADIVEGLVITAELDRQPNQAREKLIAVLGVPTLEVKSGGRWKSDSGTAEDKLHLHWRLARPATGVNDLTRLKRARSLVSRLAGGDTSCDPVNHPVRWPGSWHRKAEPRLCQIVVQNSEIEVELDRTLEVLIEAATAAGISEERPRSLNGDGSYADASGDWAQLFGRIIRGSDLHVSTRDLAAKLVMLIENDGAIVNLVRGLIECSNAPHDERYRVHYAKVPELVRSARQKFSVRHAPSAVRLRAILDVAASAKQNERSSVAHLCASQIRDMVAEGALAKAEFAQACGDLIRVLAGNGLSAQEAQRIIASALR